MTSRPIHVLGCGLARTDAIDVSDLLIGVEIGNSVTTAASSVAFDGFNAP